MTQTETTQLSDAITELGQKITSGAGRDANDGYVECLSSALMGVTAGLCKIAESQEEIAGAIRELADAQRQDD